MSYSIFFPSGSEINSVSFLPQLIRPDDWARLTRYGQETRHATDEIIVRQGEKDRTLYVVLGGSLKVILNDPATGTSRPLNSIPAGSMFGEQAFLDDLARTADVRAETDCRLMRFTYPAFERMAQADPQLALAFVFDLGRILSHRLRRALGQQIDV